MSLVRPPKVRKARAPTDGRRFGSWTWSRRHGRGHESDHGGSKGPRRGVSGSVASATAGGQCPQSTPVDPPKWSWCREKHQVPREYRDPTRRGYSYRSVGKQSSVTLASLARDESRSPSPNEHRPPNTDAVADGSRTNGCAAASEAVLVTALNHVTSRGSSFVGLNRRAWGFRSCRFFPAGSEDTATGAFGSCAPVTFTGGE